MSENKNTSPIVSVIVPVYNQENRLTRCVDSILKQTYTNFELILIDDGSKDKSLTICNDYTTKDNRIVVLHQENAGVSVARNLGIDNARGKWLCFVDSDDYVTEFYIQDLLEQVEKYGEKDTMYVSGILNCKRNNNGEISRKPMQVMNDRLYVIDDKLERVTHGHIFAKLFDTTIVNENNIRFPEGIKYFEDEIFVSRYLLYVDRISTISRYDYLYELSAASATMQKVSYDDAIKSFKLAFAERKKLVQKYHVSDEKIFWKTNAVSESLSILVLSLFSLPNKKVYTSLKNMYDNYEFMGFLKYYPIRNVRSRISRFFLSHRLKWCYVLFNRLIVMTGHAPSV